MQCDLAIIGAGPAGCAAALRARQAGLSVVLIERSTRAKQRPGETLHPGVEPLFEQLGIAEKVRAAGFHRHRGIWRESEGKRTFAAYGEDHRGAWLGFQAVRPVFDALLQKAASEAGAVFLRPCRVTGILQNEKAVVAGLTTSHGPIHAGFIADASGSESFMARALQLKVQRYGPPFRVRFGWDSHDDPELEACPIISATATGWNWRASIGAGRSAWVTLQLASEPGAPTARGGSLTLQWQQVPHCAGPNYFLLGDAAATSDPSSSHGTLLALLSGIYAAHLIEAIKQGTCGLKEGFEMYRQWMFNQFQADVMAKEESFLPVY